MIELTNASYFLLIVLSVEFGYILHGVVDAIKDGTFFDWGDEDEHERK